MRQVSVNKNVLSSRLNSVRQMSCCRSSAGSCGPATPKLLSPSLDCVRGTRRIVHVWASAERRCRCPTSVTSWQSSNRYEGARRWSDLYRVHRTRPRYVLRKVCVRVCVCAAGNGAILSGRGGSVTSSSVAAAGYHHVTLSCRRTSSSSPARRRPPPPPPLTSSTNTRRSSNSTAGCPVVPPRPALGTFTVPPRRPSDTTTQQTAGRRLEAVDVMTLTSDDARGVCEEYEDTSSTCEDPLVGTFMTLTSEDEMRAAFRVFDLDGNGLIDSDELRLTMSQLGEAVTQQDVDAMIRAVDKNNDGKVDYEGPSSHSVCQRVLRFNDMFILIHRNCCKLANSKSLYGGRLPYGIT